MKGNIKISEILAYLNENNIGYAFTGDRDASIYGFSTLFSYQPGSVTFLVPEREILYYNEKPITNRITLIFAGEKMVDGSDDFENVIKVHDPRGIFFSVIDNFFPQIDNDEEITGITANPEVYGKQSYISEKARIGRNVKIGVGCVIEGNVQIGDGTEIHHHVIIRRNTKIGKRCTIHSGTIIGERGFNYTVDENGCKHMIKHYGGVTIEDDVHIGDNCCIIQGTINDTVIRRGVKINTLVHIAHNDDIGEDTVITLPSHICGSVKIGKGCHIAAACIRNQLTVGDHAMLGLGSVVVKDIPAGDKVCGNPAKPMTEKKESEG